MHPQLHDPQLGVLSLSSDPRQPVLVDWEPKFALQGCSIAEGEKVVEQPLRAWQVVVAFYPCPRLVGSSFTVA